MTDPSQTRRLRLDRTLPNRALRHVQDRVACLGRQLHGSAFGNPAVAGVLLLAVGVATGAGLRDGVGFAEQARLEKQAQGQGARIDAAQREVNALAARLGELQAQANRLNALGERLTQAGQLEDGEFDFDKPVPQGGVGPVRDMAPSELRRGMDGLAQRFQASGEQLSVLESLLFNRKLEAATLPSRAPVLVGYVTSGFGNRADPFGGGSQFHKGIDFDANTGDPVLAVADGVVSYSGVRSGYGNVIEVDHGNGYVTRYAHNSRLLVQVGELVRAGSQVAKAGSTGRSTGAHVHFEVWENGRVVNPRQFLGQMGIKRG